MQLKVSLIESGDLDGARGLQPVENMLVDAGGTLQLPGPARFADVEMAAYYWWATNGAR